jgi:hypothetical protein
VSLAVCSTPTEKPGPDQHSPLDRPTSTQGEKRKRVIIYNNNKDMQEKGCDALIVEDWGQGILPRTVSKQVGQARESWWEPGPHPATRSRKACESGRGRKTPQERGEDPLSTWTVNKHCGWQEQQHCPVIRSGKACKSGSGRKTPQERREVLLPMGAVNKHAGLREQVQCQLSQCVWKGESLYQRLAHRGTPRIKACRARWVLSSPLRSA